MPPACRVPLSMFHPDSPLVPPNAKELGEGDLRRDKALPCTPVALGPEYPGPNWPGLPVYSSVTLQTARPEHKCEAGRPLLPWRLW